MADSVTESTFPVILGRDLPIHSGAIEDEDTVLTIIGNTRLMRVPITSLTERSLTLAGEVPESPAASGEAGDIIWTADGVYTYLDGTWGLSPRVTGHWGDYSQDSRFLVVDKEQGLSEGEQKQGRGNLGIVSATDTVEGLVQLKYHFTDEDTGNLTIPTVTAVIDYFHLFTVDVTTGLAHATTDSYGTVILSEGPAFEDEGILTSGQVYKYVSEKTRHATTVLYGTVKLATNVATDLIGEGVPTAAMVRLYVTELKGTKEEYGIVKLAEDVENGTGNEVPTAEDVQSYVESYVGNKKATTSDFGIVQLAEDIESGTGDEVATAEDVKSYVEGRNATTSGYGSVQLAEDIESGTGDQVATAEDVKSYVEGKKATTSVYGIVKLAEAITESNPDIPTAGMTYSYFHDTHATTEQYGTIKLAESVVSGDNNIATSGQIADYIASQIQAQAAYQFTAEEVALLKKLAAMKAVKGLTEKEKEPEYLLVSDTLEGIEQVEEVPEPEKERTFYIIEPPGTHPKPSSTEEYWSYSLYESSLGYSPSPTPSPTPTSPSPTSAYPSSSPAPTPPPTSSALNQ